MFNCFHIFCGSSFVGLFNGLNYAAICEILWVTATVLIFILRPCGPWPIKPSPRKVFNYEVPIQFSQTKSEFWMTEQSFAFELNSYILRLLNN